MSNALADRIDRAIAHRCEAGQAQRAISAIERLFAEINQEARAHLGAAIAQSIASDDQIIMDHVREAYRLLGAQPGKGEGNGA